MNKIIENKKVAVIVTFPNNKQYKVRVTPYRGVNNGVEGVIIGSFSQYVGCGNSLSFVLVETTNEVTPATPYIAGVKLPEITKNNQVWCQRYSDIEFLDLPENVQEYCVAVGGV